MNDLEVCKACGWHRLLNHVCYPAAGKAADDLILRVKEMVPEVEATKLGYGDLRVTFEFFGDCSITLRVDSEGRDFQINHLHWLKRLPQERVSTLIVFLNAFRRCGPR